MLTYYHNTKIEIEIGDIIKISKPYRKCRFKERKQVIKSISCSGKSVWYEDKRTNIKCKCGRCLNLKMSSIVNIPIVDIKIHQKRTEKERAIKLKQLLG